MRRQPRAGEECRGRQASGQIGFVGADAPEQIFLRRAGAGDFVLQFLQFGLDGLNAIARNAVITGSSGATYKGVATGEYPVGLTIEYAAQEFVAGGQKEIKLVYPVEGFFLARSPS